MEKHTEKNYIIEASILKNFFPFFFLFILKDIYQNLCLSKLCFINNILPFVFTF